MSLPRQEANALDAAFQFLLDLSSGTEKRIPTATRKRARAVIKHYPLAAGMRWTSQPACPDCGALLTTTGPRCTDCAGPMEPRHG